MPTRKALVMTEVLKPSKALLVYLSRNRMILNALEDIASGRVTFVLKVRWKKEPPSLTKQPRKPTKTRKR
jgi:hypothetical protein